MHKYLLSEVEASRDTSGVAGRFALEEKSLTVRETYQNPVIPGFFPDPSVCRVGEDYWLATSSFEYFPGVPIFHSRNLTDWKLVSHAIHRPEQLDLTQQASSNGIFAPTLRYHRGTFYLITTDVGGLGNFILTAQDPAGEWSQPIPIQEGEGFTWFDPSLHFDDDGTVYYTRRHAFHLVQAEINPQTGKLLSELRPIHQQFTSDDIEGPHLYHIGDWYYLLAAEGGTGWGHAISIGRSPSPWGPFEPCPHNPILTHRHLVNYPIRYTGHGDLIEAVDGSWWMVCLGTRHQRDNGAPFHHLGRETFLAPVEWRDGWPMINDGQPLGERMDRLTLPSSSAEVRAEKKDFLAEPLGLHWIYRRAPSPEHLQQNVEQGLVLWGQAANLNEVGPVTFIGQRLDQPYFRLRTELNFMPQAEGEEAGLCLFMAEDYHAEVAVRRTAAEPRLVVRQRAANLEAVQSDQEHEADCLLLQIEGDWKHFRFSAGSSIDSLNELCTIDRRLLCTEVTGGWTGLVAGLYATGNGQLSRAPATFPWFEHHRSADR